MVHQGAAIDEVVHQGVGFRLKLIYDIMRQPKRGSLEEDSHLLLEVQTDMLTKTVLRRRHGDLVYLGVNERLLGMPCLTGWIDEVIRTRGEQEVGVARVCKHKHNSCESASLEPMRHNFGS